MDINFHYFAVKVTAVMTGYSDQDADEIATYSQYVDDYFDNNTFKVNTPPPFDTPIYSQNSKVSSVETGIEVSKSLTKKHQTSVIIPFHFIPPQALSIAGDGYRTTPAQWQDFDHQLIVQMLHTLIDHHSSHPGFRLFMGMLLHIFADTYAHQTFNGFHKKNINDGRVIQATEAHLDGSSCEKSYGIYAELPAIGHTDLGTAPDETALTYTCMRDTGSGQMVTQPERTNADVFLNCAYGILRILREARHASAPEEREFRMLEQELRKGFLIPCTSSISQLCTHWLENVPEINGTAITYNYDARVIHDRFFSIREEKLPQNMTVAQTSDLLCKIAEQAEEQETETQKLASAYNELDHLTALGAVNPTNHYYYYNTCAYRIRELVNH